MTTDSARPGSSSTEGEYLLFDEGFDPLENGVRTRIRSFIENLLEAELDAALGRARYRRAGAGEGGPRKGAAGSRHGHRDRRILGTFGATTVRVRRARLVNPERGGSACLNRFPRTISGVLPGLISAAMFNSEKV